ncbi:uncharacterized protein V6R79_014697 [Siganus canaliculatus]
MLYTELLQLWDAAAQAVDARDWQGALAKLEQITEPTSRTLFNAASAHLALGQLDLAMKALDLTLSKDERLAVGFFQRSAVMMQVDRLEEALSDCIWAQKHMRGNVVIDYKQLGLRFKLYSWQVLYNAAAVYCRMGQWEQARDVLLSISQEKGGGRGGNIEVALDSIVREEALDPLMVPEGVVFRPRKQDLEQLQQRDFLGKAKVISSMIPNDDFGGFEPLRLQKPGFYEPKVVGAQDSRYMRVQTPYMARGPGQLTVPGGATVFLFGEEDRDGMVNVIFDGQRGLLPVSLLEPADLKTPKGKKDNSIASGIPLPPGLKPPTRPKVQSSPAAPPPVHVASDTPPPPSYATATHAQLSASEPPKYTANAATNQHDSGAQGAESGSVLVKVHFTYTVALSVPLDTPYSELKEQIAQKLGQPASVLRLRYKQHGSRVLTPLGSEAVSGLTVQEVAEAGRATLWCQKEDPLQSRTILYQMVALYDYAAQGPEDLEFSEGDTIDILGEDIFNGHISTLSKCSIVYPQLIHRWARGLNQQAKEVPLYEEDTISYTIHIDNRKHLLHRQQNRGVIVLGNETYGLEPVPRSAANEHLLYLPVSCGVVNESTSAQSHEPFEPGQSLTSLLRKKRNSPQTRYMELVMVVDNLRVSAFIRTHLTYEPCAMYHFKKQNETAVREETAEMANLIDGYYKKLNIRVVLVGLAVFRDSNPFSVEGSAGEVLGRFVKWRQTSLVPHIRHDMGQLIIGSSSFSTCSAQDFEALINRGGGVCLNNQPAPSDVIGTAECGDGRLDKGEDCDCGKPEVD